VNVGSDAHEAGESATLHDCVTHESGFAAGRPASRVASSSVGYEERSVTVRRHILSSMVSSVHGHDGFYQCPDRWGGDAKVIERQCLARLACGRTDIQRRRATVSIVGAHTRPVSRVARYADQFEDHSECCSSRESPGIDTSWIDTQSPPISAIM